jgi:transcriptional regulator with XRE-family HTH domain
MASRPDKAGSRGRDSDTIIHTDLGPRLRAEREARALSLRELARRLQISPSALSQIETGSSRPSVSTLYAIVTELGLSLDELFTERRDEAGRSARAESPEVAAMPPADAEDGRHVQRSASRTAIDLESGVRWERLTPRHDADVDFLFVRYDPGGSSSVNDTFIRHSGREYGLVLSGTLEVRVGFDHYVLGPGDSICFDSTVPHSLRNTGSEPVEGIWFVVGRQHDERASGFEDTFRPSDAPPPPAT